MQFEIFTAFVICAFVYVVARIVGWAEAENSRRSREVREEDRLERVANLYGRSRSEK